MDDWIKYLFLESIICLILTILLYFYYVRKGTNIIVSIVSILTWFLTFVLIVLLPYDITFSMQNDSKKETKETTIIKYIYAFDYWTIYILSWFVIPVIQSYEKSGYFNQKDKLKDAIKANLLFFAFFFLFGVVATVFLLFQKGISVIDELPHLIILMSVCWGLFQVFFLMGYSIIKLPTDLYSHYLYENRERYFEWRIMDLKENLYEIKYKFNKHYNKLKNTKETIEKSSNSPLLPFKKNINELFNSIDKNTNVKDFPFSKEDFKIANNEKDLIKLNKKLKSEIIDFQRSNYLQNQIYQKWLLVISLIQLKKTKPEKESLSPELANKKIKYLEISCFQKFYYLYIRQILILILMVIVVIFEIIILLSEISTCLEDILHFKYILIFNKERIFLNHFIIIFQILFLFYLCFYSLFQMKISFLCRIYGHRQTDSLSILFITYMMCNIGYPICINFTQISKNENAKIYQIYGYKNLTGVSKTIFEKILRFYPFLLFVLIVLNYFNVINKIGSCMGITSFTVKDEDTLRNIDEGKEVLINLNKAYGNNFYKISEVSNKIEIL